MEADDLRREHPGCGVEKLYFTLKPNFIGRDRFVDTFMQLGYRVRTYKNYRRTTYASNIYYSNLIKGLEITSPSVVWQSDITYIRVGDNYYYAVFILDVYTRKIVGYQVSDHMRATANVKALMMAFKDHQAPMVHHSDRGSQYTYKDYISLLKQSGCSISMGLIAQDNAYAERINRTIKEEYLNYWKPQNFQQLKQKIKKAVENYNTKRAHKSLNYLTPKQFELQWSTLELKERPLMVIFDDEINV
jgi:transposase InsO family protein